MSSVQPLPLGTLLAWQGRHSEPREMEVPTAVAKTAAGGWWCVLSWEPWAPSHGALWSGVVSGHGPSLECLVHKSFPLEHLGWSV